MAVLIESDCVVVRNVTIADRYPGGMDAYRDDCPNATFCLDDHLCRVGFRVAQDAEVFAAARSRTDKVRRFVEAVRGA
jgi:hypothetical protein